MSGWKACILACDACFAVQCSAKHALTCRFIFLSVNQCSDPSLLRALRSSSSLRDASLLLCSLLSQGSIDDSDPAWCMRGFFCQLASQGLSPCMQNVTAVCRKILSCLIQIIVGAIGGPFTDLPCRNRSWLARKDGLQTCASGLHAPSPTKPDQSCGSQPEWGQSSDHGPKTQV